MSEQSAAMSAILWMVASWYVNILACVAVVWWLYDRMEMESWPP